MLVISLLERSLRLFYSTFLFFRLQVSFPVPVQDVGGVLQHAAQAGPLPRSLLLVVAVEPFIYANTEPPGGGSGGPGLLNSHFRLLRHQLWRASWAGEYELRYAAGVSVWVQWPLAPCFCIFCSSLLFLSRSPSTLPTRLPASCWWRATGSFTSCSGRPGPSRDGGCRG